MCVYIENTQALQYLVLLDIHHAYCIHLRTEIELKLTMNMCVYCTGIAWIHWMCALKYICVCGHVFVCWVCTCIYIHALRYRNVCTVCASMCMRLCVYKYINIVTTVIRLVDPSMLIADKVNM